MKGQLGNLDNPRKNAIDAMKSSVPQHIWENNLVFIDTLKKIIRNHPVSQHDAIDALNKGAFDKKAMKLIQRG